MMAGLKKMVALLTMVLVALLSLLLGGKLVGAQQAVHHVVGGDRGWDASSDVPSWSSGKTFRVGDKIWFTYSAAQGSVAELGSKKEYEACDVSKPIRMLTEGLDVISLEEEGIRYFASSSSEHCKNGLKLHVAVLPQQYPGAGIRQVTASEEHEAIAKGTLAGGPTSPSGSAQLSPSPFLFALFGLLGLLMIRH